MTRPRDPEITPEDPTEEESPIEEVPSQLEEREEPAPAVAEHAQELTLDLQADREIPADRSPAEEELPRMPEEAVPSAEAELRAQVQELQRESEQYKDKWMRAMAELENFRRRMRRDMETSLNLANATLLRSLLEVVDNFGRALENVPSAEDGAEDPLTQGVRLIHEQLQSLLRENGVTRIPAEDAAFDPNLHEAISQIESEEVPSGHVAQVVQEGYLLRDLVLRPARVVVAL